jgi:hypothetical protein
VNQDGGVAPTGTAALHQLDCNPGDFATGGSANPANVASNHWPTVNIGQEPTGWSFMVHSPTAGIAYSIYVVCADVTP